MTDYELQKSARLTAKYIVEAIKEDDELMDLLYPSRPLDVKEAAAFLHMSVSRLLHIAQDVPHEKVGKKLYFTERGLTRWIRRTGREEKVKVIEMVPERKRKVM